MRDLFGEVVANRGPQSVRFMGTAAIGILLGLPPEVRDEVFAHVQRERWTNNRDVDHDEVWSVFEAALKAHWGIDDGAVPSERG